MSQIGVAVAGTGFIGPVHIEALNRLPNVRVTGVLGSSAQKSEKARKDLGLPKGYANLDEVLDDPDVKSVHLAIPNVLHYEYVKRVLAAGKHVMCEKPLAMNAEESAELVELARESGLEAGVTYNVRFYPINLQVRNMISSGEMGEIRAVKGQYVQDWLFYDTDYNWRVLAEKGGELRALSDIGTHWIDLVTSMTGLEVEAVLADLLTVHPIRKRPVGEVETFSGKQDSGPIEREEVEITTEDCASVLFRFKGGAKGQLWVSQVTAGRKNSIKYEISASEKSVAWHSMEPNELWIGNRDEPNQELVRDPALMLDLPNGFTDYPGGHNEGFPDTFKQCFRAFYASVAGESDEALYPTFEEGHKEIVLCDAMLKSHKEERWITV